MTLYELAQSLKRGRGNYDQYNPDRCIVGLLFQSLGLSIKEARREMNRTWKGEGTILSRQEFEKLFFIGNWPEDFQVAFDAASAAPKFVRDRRMAVVAGERIEHFLGRGE